MCSSCHNHDFPCPDKSCRHRGCMKMVTVEPYNSFEDENGDCWYMAYCYALTPPEEFKIRAEEFELRKIESLQAQARTPAGETKKTIAQKKPKRGRQGSKLKGKRTQRMLEQLDSFKIWLNNHPINENKPGCSVGARANQFWLQHNKTFERDKKRTGEKRGYPSHKTLATAFRNSK